MRIRRRPAVLLLSPPLPPHPSSPDLSKTSDEPEDDEHGGTQPAASGKEEDLHSVGVNKLEAIGASPSPNPKCNERALFPHPDLDAILFCGSVSSPATALKEELPKMKESLLCQPSVNSCKSSSAQPPSPEKKRAAKANLPGNASSEKKTGSNGGKEEGSWKKRRSPAVLMEGSRCSRMNGRGWRCCQKTLVGYSLCEHHLGKGRLRSVSAVKGSVGSRTTVVGGPFAGEKRPAQPETSVGVDGSDVWMKKKLRKNKIGMVKARSISSLLDDCKIITATSPEIPIPPPPPLLRRLSDIEETV